MEESFDDNSNLPSDDSQVGADPTGINRKERSERKKIKDRESSMVTTFYITNTTTELVHECSRESVSVMLLSIQTTTPSIIALIRSTN